MYAVDSILPKTADAAYLDTQSRLYSCTLDGEHGYLHSIYLELGASGIKRMAVFEKHCTLHPIANRDDNSRWMYSNQ